MRGSALLLVSAALVLGGCKKKRAGDVDGASFKITDRGIGEPNAEPLQPMNTGTYEYVEGLDGSAFREGTHVDGRVDIDGLELVRQADTNFTTGYLQVERDAWFAKGEDGLFIVGRTDDGMLDNPRLHVPTEVKVGMKWEVPDPPNDEPIVYEVLSVETLATTWGTGPVWTIRQTLPSSIVWDRLYLEGSGIVALVNVDDGGFAVGPDRYVPDGFRVLEPQPETAPQLDRLALESVGIVGEELVVPDQRQWSGAHRTGDGETTIWLALGVNFLDAWGYVDSTGDARCLDWTGGSLSEITNSDPGGYGILDTRCARIGDGLGSVTAAPEHVLVSQSGRWVMGDDTSNIGDRTVASWLDDSDEPRILWGRVQGMPGGSNWAELSVNDDQKTVWEPARESSAIRDSLQYVASWPFPTAWGRILTPNRLDEDGTMPMLQIGHNGEILHGRFSDDRIRDWKPVGRISGRVSTFTTPDGRDFLHTTEDGDVDRIIIESDGVRFERVAQLDLPERHHLISAYEIDGELLAFTWEHPDWAAELADDGQIPLNNTWYAWTAQLDGAPVAWEPPAAGGVTVQDSGADQFVCWPDNGQPVDTAGWTLGGVPATVVPAIHRSCATVVRDHTVNLPFDGTALYEEYGFPETDTLAGALPGIGRFTAHTADTAPLGNTHIDMRRIFDDQNPGYSEVAMLAGGGLVMRSGRFDPGMLMVDAGLSEFGQPDYLGDIAYVVPDVAGNGMWFIQGGVLKRYGPDGLVTYDIDDAYALQEAAVGGGVSVRTSSADFVVLPDGTTADSVGTTCSATASSRICMLPDGSFWEPEVGTDAYMLMAGQMHPIDETTSLVVWTGNTSTPGQELFGLWIMDFTAKTVSRIAEGTPRYITRDGDGGLWATWVDASIATRQAWKWDEMHFGKVDASGVTEVTLPLPIDRFGGDLHVYSRVLVDEDLFYVFISGEIAANGDEFIRVPRD